MRHAPKSDQEKAEIAAVERADRRKGGFSLGKIRDTGQHRLSNGIAILWHVDVPLAEGESRRHIPDGKFLLDTGKEEILFDVDEFHHYLRWA